MANLFVLLLVLFSLISSYASTFGFLCAADAPGIAQAAEAEAKFDARDWAGALELYESALRLAPTHCDAAEMHFNCGYCLAELGRTADAITAYTTAISLNPEDAEAYNHRGHCHFVLRNIEQALADFNRSIELCPALAEAYDSRAEVWAHRKQWVAAIQDLRKALELTTDATLKAEWAQRLAALQAAAAAESGVAQPDAKKRSLASVVSGASAGGDEPPSKRLKASSGAKDIKAEGSSRWLMHAICIALALRCV
jgi:tetratricopeptide (TPR) repeat protein